MIRASRSLVLVLVVSAALVAVAAGSAAGAPGRASLFIRHQTHGCHSWAVNGGAYKATQTITLRRGASLTVTNDDVMPHTLVLTKGPALTIAHAKLGHTGASLKLVLKHPGVYRFTTRVGDDYPGLNVKTIGEDNVLKLTVVVS
jgi:plastocyanin